MTKKILKNENKYILKLNIVWATCVLVSISIIAYAWGKLPIQVMSILIGVSLFLFGWIQTGDF